MIERLKLQTDPKIKKKVVELKVTGRIAEWILSKLKFTLTGTTISLPFLFVIVYLQSAKDNPKNMALVRIHENQHMLQSESMGPFFVFWLKYIWQDVKWFYMTLSLSDMYYNQKYEAEAYDVQDEVANGKLPYPEWAKGPL